MQLYKGEERNRDMLMFKQIKQDLRRNKAINLIVLLIVTIAALLLAISINLLGVCFGGGDELIKKGKVGDAMVYISSSEEKDEEINEYFEKSKNVTSFESIQMIAIDKKNLKLKKSNGESADLLSSVTYMVSTVTKDLNLVFDADNNVLKSINKGDVYLPYYFQKLYEIEVGDELEVKISGKKYKFNVGGFFKDPALGSSMMAIKRLLLNADDYESVKDKAEENSLFALDTVFFDEDYNSAKFDKDFADDTDYSPVAIFSSQVFSLSTFMDNGITAALLLVVSIVVITIVILILSFLIQALIRDEYRTIGVMKAIGIPNLKIKSIYLYKYTTISIVGAVVGLVLSTFVTSQITENFAKSLFLPDNSTSLFYSIIAEVVMVACIVLLMLKGMKKVNKHGPIDFLHGQIEKRKKNKSVIKIHKTNGKNIGGVLAINEVVSKWNQYIVLCVVFTLCVLLLEIPLDLNNTVNQDGFIKDYCGITYGDMYILDRETYNESGYVDLDEVKEDFKEVKEELSDDYSDIQLVKEYYGSALISSKKGDIQKNYTFVVGDEKNQENAYIEGKDPIKKDEIAITTIVATQYNVSVGDKLNMKIGDDEITCTVSGIFQSVYNAGEIIRLGQKYETDKILSVKYIAKFSEDAESKIGEIKDDYSDWTIYSAQEYLGDSVTSLSSAITSIVLVVVVVDLIILFMLTYVFVVLFINREKSEIAVLKSIGTKSGIIRKWQGNRIIIILLFALILGIVISQLTGSGLIQSALSGYGIAKITLVSDAMISFGAVPLVFLIITVLGILLGMTQVKKIKFQSMNE